MQTAIITAIDDAGNTLTATIRSRNRKTAIISAFYTGALINAYPEAKTLDYQSLVNAAQGLSALNPPNGAPPDVGAIMSAFANQNGSLRLLDSIELFSNVAARLTHVEGAPFAFQPDGRLQGKDIVAAYEHFSNEPETEGFWAEAIKEIVAMDMPAAPEHQAVNPPKDSPFPAAASESGNPSLSES